MIHDQIWIDQRTNFRKKHCHHNQVYIDSNQCCVLECISLDSLYFERLDCHRKSKLGSDIHHSHLDNFDYKDILNIILISFQLKEKMWNLMI